MRRHDYAFPFRVDPASGQAMQTNYPAHVEQMIRQILLTAPGERANLPEFGCGLRQLIFAPHSEALDATTKMLVQTALERWLAGQIEVLDDKVMPLADTPDPAQIEILIEYILIETQTPRLVELRIT
jgi:phage baseplate assembly protein W